jgi:hypothetical protein
MNYKLANVALIVLLIAAGGVYIARRVHQKTASIAAPIDTSMLTVVDAGKTFTFTYPNVAALSDTVDYQVLVPKSYQPNTNFSEAKFTVAASADAEAVSGCLTSTDGGPAQAGTPVMINGTSYMKLSYADAGAGNFYETTSYRTVHGGQCYRVEYTIHSTNIANYPEELGIKEFDKAKVTGLLESIAQSFKFL